MHSYQVLSPAWQVGFWPMFPMLRVISSTVVPAMFLSPENGSSGLWHCIWMLLPTAWFASLAAAAACNAFLAEFFLTCWAVCICGWFKAISIHICTI